MINKYSDDPITFLNEANIIYCAPGDAADTNLPDSSIDLHFSCTVFEHIPYSVLDDIMNEAKRILKPNALSVHLIDPSDHFQHQDSTITRINFLKYSDRQWMTLAGNNFAYCNRLRYPQHQEIFYKNGFRILFEDKHLDAESHSALKAGFHVHQDFKRFSNEELSVTAYNVILENGK